MARYQDVQYIYTLETIVSLQGALTHKSLVTLGLDHPTWFLMWGGIKSLHDWDFKCKKVLHKIHQGHRRWKNELLSAHCLMKFWRFMKIFGHLGWERPKGCDSYQRGLFFFRASCPLKFCSETLPHENDCSV